MTPRTIADLRTPAVLVDVARVNANISRMQASASAHGLRLRPHAKTHKSPVIARWQLEAGAVGVCCAKLAEAEVFADAGIDDLRLPYPIQPSNADRVVRLLDRARISIVVDDLTVAQAWSAAMCAAGRTLDVLVKVDVGFHRCGIDPDSPDAGRMVAAVGSLPALRLKGVLSHAGHGYQARSEEELASIAAEEARLLQQVAACARSQGATIEEISVGATPTARFNLTAAGLTELRPGNYVYFDRTQVALGAATLGDCALTVLASVVSRHQDRVIVDSGSKTLSTDLMRGDPKAGYGLVFRDVETGSEIDEGLHIERLSEEHATVRVMSATRRPDPGDRVRILPNHSCVVSNLVDEVVLVDGTRVLERLPVAARGRTW
ncbi:MAG TPA: alanine racemase [Vicinamibacterales bacterium]|nr:alanine racemase [Vicinamibacterales bacterium]